MLRAAIILTVLLSALSARAEPARIVTAGSAVTEIAAALGLAPQIVAVDSSSKHLAETRDKSDVGYVRLLGAEGILSHNPDLVLVSSEAGPAPVLDQVRAAGVDVVVVPNGRSLDSIDDKIRSIAAATGRIADGDKLIARVESDVRALRVATSGAGERPAVVFLFARHGGNLMAAGSDTAAHAMIEASGGHNACEAFSGYKPLSAEVFAASTPAYVIVSESVGSNDTELLAAVPGFAAAQAAGQLRIIRVDDTAFLGFGPRAPSAAAQVALALRHP